MANQPNKPTFKASDYPSTGLGSQDALQRFMDDLSSYTGNASDALIALNFNQNFNGEVKVVQIQTPVAGLWTPFTYASGFSDFGGGFEPGAYMKDSNGYVHLRGNIKNSATTAAGTTFTTLPSGFCPPYTTQWGAVLNNAFAYMTVQSNGACSLSLTTGSSAISYSSVAGQFQCADASPGAYSCFPQVVTSKYKNINQCLLLGVADVTTKGVVQTPLAGLALHWAPYNNNAGTTATTGISILNISGLLPGKKYSVTLALLNDTSSPGGT